jgi:hypothetical protein
MKTRFMLLIVCISLSVIVAVASIHYSYSNVNQQITEVPLCGGAYLPAYQAGNLCEANKPDKVISRVVREKNKREYYGLGLAGLILLSGLAIASKIHST